MLVAQQLFAWPQHVLCRTIFLYKVVWLNCCPCGRTLNEIQTVCLQPGRLKMAYVFTCVVLVHYLDELFANFYLSTPKKKFIEDSSSRKPFHRSPDWKWVVLRNLCGDWKFSITPPIGINQTRPIGNKSLFFFKSFCLSLLLTLPKPNVSKTNAWAW